MWVLLALNDDLFTGECLGCCLLVIVLQYLTFVMGIGAYCFVFRLMGLAVIGVVCFAFFVVCYGYIGLSFCCWCLL